MRNRTSEPAPQEAPAPQTIIVNHNPFVDSAQVRRIVLSPRSPSQQKRSQTVGYMQGDIPEIIIHSGHRKFRLAMGQCIHLGGEPYMIENPYSRTAEVQIAHDYPLSIGFADTNAMGTRPANHVTYFTGASYPDPVGGDSYKGMAILQEDGSAIYHIEATSKTDVLIFPNARAEFMDSKPATFMVDDLKLLHPSGDEIHKVKCIGGYFSEALKLEWIAASGYDATKIVAALVNDDRLTIQLDKGAAMFITNKAGDYYECNLKVTDLGVSTGPSYV